MLNDIADGFGQEAGKVLIKTMGEAWKAFTPEEKSDVSGLLFETAKARLRELAGEDIGSTVEILEDALLQWKVAGKTVFISAFKQTAREVFGLGGEFLGGALRGFIVGL